MVRRIHKKLNGFLIRLTSVDSGRSSTIHQVRFLWQRWKLLQTAIVAVGLSIFGALLAALVYAASAARDPNLPLLKVTVSVSASDPAGNPLTYRWRSTDGRIIDQDAPSTQWTLPPGPGIHFAYVLVSNGKGGYTERRIAVNTDA